jgi:RNA polymerase sigma-70 factor, ECF subfamily
VAPPDASDLADEELLARFIDDEVARSRREEAFRQLAYRYRRRLFAVCFRVLGDAEDAEDAVQETLVRLARSATSFRGDAKLSTWLYRVARNVCTDRVRYEARRPSTPVADVVELHDTADPDDPIESHAMAATVGAALQGLDDRSRQLLLLVAVDGLTYHEAAELTGLAVGTVKSRVSRARVQLGEILAEDGDDAPLNPEHPSRPTTAASGDPPVARGPPGVSGE